MAESTTSLNIQETTVFDNISNSTNSSRIFFYQTEQVSFLIVLFILIVTGNCTVLTILSMSGKIRSRMNLFMANLACADLMVGIFLVLTDVISKITITWDTGDVGCKIVKFLQAMSTYASTYSLVALSLDRLDVVIRPLKRAGNGKTWTLIPLAWVFAGLFAIPMLVTFFIKEAFNMKHCMIEFSEQWMWQLYISLIAVAVFVIPAFIIAFCYIVIVTVLWRKATFSLGSEKSNGRSPQHIINRDGKTVGTKKEKRVRWTNHGSSSRGVIPRAKIKTIKMTFVIVLAFIFCWSPYFVFDLMYVYGQIPDPTSERVSAINTFIQSLAPLNSAANPFIFLLFNFNTVKNVYRRRNRHLYSPPTTQTHL